MEWVYVIDRPAPATAYELWELRHEGILIWIQSRPPYCDRGHWCAGVEGIRTIDWAGAFPRYYMDLQRAKDEMKDWLLWRLQRERDSGVSQPGRED